MINKKQKQWVMFGIFLLLVYLIYNSSRPSDELPGTSTKIILYQYDQYGNLISSTLSIYSTYPYDITGDVLPIGAVANLDPATTSIVFDITIINDGGPSLDVTYDGMNLVGEFIC